MNRTIWGVQSSNYTLTCHDTKKKKNNNNNNKEFITLPTQ